MAEPHTLATHYDNTSAVTSRSGMQATVKSMSNNVISIVMTSPKSSASITVNAISSGANAMPKVEVATVGKTASGSVFLICLASFLIGCLTGFHAVYPPMALLACGISALLYVISLRLAKQWAD